MAAQDMGVEYGVDGFGSVVGFRFPHNRRSEGSVRETSTVYAFGLRPRHLAGVHPETPGRWVGFFPRLGHAHRRVVAHLPQHRPVPDEERLCQLAVGSLQFQLGRHVVPDVLPLRQIRRPNPLSTSGNSTV